ncbi:MAG: LysR family transcriptional regulator [Lachnospiraceae bacterium]
MEHNLNLYYIFYTVATCQNISAAAKELYISQPAISKAISKLEQNLNIVLFIRNSRGVSLTEEGACLYEQLTQAFQCIKNGEDRIKKMNELGVGHITIGVSTTLCKYVLLPYLKKFIQNNPHVKIEVICQSSSKTLMDIDQGTLDIGLVGLVALPEKKKGIVFTSIAKIQDTFVTTNNYLNYLKIRDGLSKKSILNNATFIMLEKENLSRKYMDEQLHNSDITLSNIMEVNNMDLLIDFAKIDLGISCVIKDFVLEDLKQKNLIEIKVVDSIPKRELGFVYSTNTFKENKMIEKFLKDN